MDIRVLVAYASKYGATKEIAEKIGEVLNQAGLQTDVLTVKSISVLTPYQAVVLGSAAYIGRWRKEAVRFLEKNEAALKERAVWIFSSGPTGEGSPIELTKGWRYPEKLKPVIDRILPRDTAIFHGMVDVEKLNFLEKFAVKNVKAPSGDFRDWDAITDWATSIAQSLKEQGKK